MKNYSLIKVFAVSLVLLTAMAFSCQDHHVPDPDPVIKCNRVDGSPRAFPCEFEIIKIEYYAGKTNRIIGVSPTKIAYCTYHQTMQTSYGTIPGGKMAL